jgi:thiol:disulfide interchange protein
LQFFNVMHLTRKNKFYDMNKKIWALLAFFIVATNAVAQLATPSTWSYKVSPSAAKVGDEIDLVFNVKIDQNWYLYSSDFDPNLGPITATFTFTDNGTFKAIGKVKPVGAKKKMDEIFGGEVRYFTKTAEFRQKIKVLKDNAVIAGSYDGQVCSDLNGSCVPVGGEFSVPVEVAVAEKTAQEKTKVAPVVTASKPETKPLPETVVASKDSLEKQPDTTKNVAVAAPFAPSNTATPTNETKISAKNTPADLTPPADAYADYSLWRFMLEAFIFGLFALLTPCVFPLIPMTVSFFTKRSGTRAEGIRKALFYGLSIVLIYTVVGTLVARLNGPEFANFLSTHWFPNLLFFAIFVVFGISFLGMFEIVLPSSWVNKADAQADKGGYYGIFFMAFTLALVSFSCTGPIVGSILIQSFGGAVVKPIAGMFAFSMAFAIPFTLFAIFPSWLNNLPKSGGWLNSVKVVLGFLELALALKFFTTADQAYHWNILSREAFLALWIVLFALIGLYLLGKIRLSHDSAMSYIAVPRLLLAIVSLSFTVYLVPGLFGNPLPLLAGYLPPAAQQKHIAVAQGGASSVLCDVPKHVDILHLPHGLQGYFNYEQALACAKKQNKPVFIDFTGHGCANCRKMEENVWANPEVLSSLQNDFVLLALYVDDKTELPENEWIKSSYDGNMKKTIGKKNFDFQITRFNANAQPYYVILTPDGELLTPPQTYNLDVASFKQFLEAGLAAFKAK